MLYPKLRSHHFGLNIPRVLDVISVQLIQECLICGAWELALLIKNGQNTQGSLSLG